jgi:hypothetical protein
MEVGQDLNWGCSAKRGEKSPFVVRGGYLFPSPLGSWTYTRVSFVTFETQFIWSRQFILSLALQPPWALISDFQFHDHFTDRGTPWTSDQLVAKALPKQTTTQTQ